MTDAGIVIVTWNSAAVIGDCLDAALRWCSDIVVVDNASVDGTVDEVRRRKGVRLIANDSNRGFAAAANQGVGSLSTGLALLLNPDVVLENDPAALADACRPGRAAAAAGLLAGTDGRPQTGFGVRRFPEPWTLVFEVMGLNRLWPGNPVNRRYRCLAMDWAAPADVEQPAGAFLMVRRDAWNELGGMDEGFFPVWFEDVDLLFRLRAGGYRVFYVPTARARHLGGHSVRQVASSCREVYWYGSLLRYASKHYGRLGRVTVCGAVVIGSFARMIVGLVVGRSREPIVTYGKVVRLAGQFFLGARSRSAGRFAAASTTSWAGHESRRV